MRLALLLSVTLGAATLAAPVPVPKPKPKPVAEAILGKWRIVETHVGKVEAKDRCPTTWTFGDGYFKQEVDHPQGKMSFTFNYKLADAEPFPRFDFSAGEVTERNADHGILTIDGDTMTLSYSVEYNPAPKELKPQEGTYFYRLKRVKE